MTTKPRQQNTGMVAAGDPKTADVGASLLRQGGNAVDAAVGATFAAFSTEPILTGPFGGGFATVSDAESSAAYDFFANVPGRGLDRQAIEHPDFDFQGIEVSFGAAHQTFHVGRGAVAAPLMLPGLLALHQRYGKLSLDKVVEPAAELARNGAQLSVGLAPFLTILKPIITLTPNSQALFAPQGDVLKGGETFRSTDLAAFLARIAQGQCEDAQEALLAGFGTPAGLLTAEDFEYRHVERRRPINTHIGHFEVLLNPPPSAGGLLVAFGLELLKRAPKSVWEKLSTSMMSIVAAMATTNAARSAAIRSAPERLRSTELFLSTEHLNRWESTFLDMAEHGPRSEEFHRAPLGKHHPHQRHRCIGLGLRITSSNGEGCGHVVPGLGVLANNFMGEEDLHPGTDSIHAPRASGSPP